MKFNKTIATVSAATLAFSMVAVSASALDMGNSDASWHQEQLFSFEDGVCNISNDIVATEITKVVFKITSHIEEGGDNAKVYANSDAGWVEKSFGYGLNWEGNPYDITLTSSGSFSIEIPVEGAGGWFQIGYGASANSGSYTIDAIEFYGASGIIGTWIDGRYTEGAVDNGPDTPPVPEAPSVSEVGGPVQAQLISFTGNCPGLGLTGDALKKAVASSIYLKTDDVELVYGVDYTIEITVDGNIATVRVVMLNDKFYFADGSEVITTLKLYEVPEYADEVIEEEEVVETPDASPFMILGAYDKTSNNSESGNTDKNSSIDGTANKTIDYENVAAGAGIEDEASSETSDMVAVGAVIAAALAAAATVVAARKQRN